MLKVRLQRIGKKNQAYFRVVVTEHTTKPKGRYLELLGSYDPHKNELKVKEERVKYWLSKGAQLSPTLNNLLVGRKIIEGEKVKVWKAKKKKGKETTETAQKEEKIPEKKQEISEEKTEEPKAEVVVDKNN